MLRQAVYTAKLKSVATVLTVEELCEILRILRSTLYRLISNGEIPFFRMGSDYRFSREAIDEWQRAQEEVALKSTP